MDAASPPLCVDLDGTLIASDTTVMAFKKLLKRNPFAALMAPLWIAGGKAAFKAAVARHMIVDASRLPYNKPFLEFLRAEHARGRTLYLVTGSDIHQAQAVADQLGIFRDVWASDGRVNVTGKRKAKLLLEHLGERKFSYAGDHRRDLRVWAISASAILVNAPKWLRDAAAKLTTIEREF